MKITFFFFNKAFKTINFEQRPFQISMKNIIAPIFSYVYIIHIFIAIRHKRVALIRSAREKLREDIHLIR